MIKKFTKFFLLLLLIIIISLSSLTCFAHEGHEHSDTETITTTESTANSSEDDLDIHEGDLYLFNNTVVMDKYVDGNVFIIGNNVTITGQVNGNLYVLANKLAFEGCLIRYSIFACANNVYYNNSGTYESDVYIAANKLETTWNSYATRDFKILASDVIFKSGVGRNVDLICDNVTFGEGEDVPEIWGNLSYTANKEVTVPEASITSKGTVTYTPSNYITNILVGFGICIVTALALFIILNKLTPKFIEKINDNKFSVISLLKAFAIGLATIIITLIFIVLLTGTMVGISLAVILALLFTILCIIATPVLTIKIANTLKPVLKIEKTSIFYIVIILVSIILHGITLIPFVGIILGLIINITAIGLIVTVYLPHKELIDEEKLQIKEAKKQDKENKEKRKQEKLEAKTTKKEEKARKKQEKLEAKESKKEDKHL